MKKGTLTPEILWSLPRVGDPVPVPDGSACVVPVTRYDLETNEGKTRLWLVPLEGEARPLTDPERSASSPAPSPDGTRLAFLRKPGEGSTARHRDVPQLYVMPLSGGEPERKTDLARGVLDPRWFPDGGRLAFAAPVFLSSPTPEETAIRRQEIEDDPVKARVTENRLYRYWDRWLTDGEVLHIFALDLHRGDLLDLIPEFGKKIRFMDDSKLFCIAPDGAEIAFSAVVSDPPFDELVSGVYRVAVPALIREGRKPGRVVFVSRGDPANSGSPIYSPDGAFLLYGMQREKDFYADRVRVVALDRKTKRKKVLTEDWDRSAGGFAFGRSPRKLFLTAETEGRTSVFVLEVGKAIRNPARNPPREVVRGGTFGSPRVAGGRIFANLSSLTEPPEVVVFPETGGTVEKLTDFARLEGIELGRIEEEEFVGAGNDPVRMFLIHPPGQSGGKRLPLVHLIHGGPHGIFGDQWHWRWNAQVFAAPGYLVAMVNFHGSTSFGQEFAASILGRWGDQPTEDVMLATDHLVSRGLVDERRMAATGGSYGGYLVSWLAGRTDRFACLVNHAGVSDFQTQYASDVTHGRARSMGGEPWDRIEGMDRFNPIRQAKGFRSPMLVLHGERDYRVPYAQGLAIYNVYKAMKLPARLVVYPEENHWILKPRASLHWYGEFLAWLSRWLG